MSTKKTSVGHSAKLEFGLNADGSVTVAIKTSKGVSPKLVQAVELAKDSFFKSILASGEHVPVLVGGKVIVAPRFKP